MFNIYLSVQKWWCFMRLNVFCSCLMTVRINFILVYLEIIVKLSYFVGAANHGLSSLIATESHRKSGQKNCLFLALGH